MRAHDVTPGYTVQTDLRCTMRAVSCVELVFLKLPDLRMLMCSVTVPHHTLITDEQHHHLLVGQPPDNQHPHTPLYHHFGPDNSFKLSILDLETVPSTG
jgi:hypothetical protein